MIWVAVLGAGREQIPLLEACNRAGCRSVSFDIDPEGAGVLHSNRFFHISNRDTHRIVGVLAQWPDLRGVICAGTEAAVEVATVAKALHLPHSLEAAEICRDKLEQKTRLALRGVPHTECLASLHRHYLKPPFVVKPRFGSGSRGVSLVSLPGEHEEAYGSAKRVVFLDDREQEALVEPYQPGPQLSVEVVVWDGRCVLVAMVDRHYDDSKLPQFVELGGTSPSVHDDAWRIPIAELMARAAEAVGLKRGTLKGDIVLAPDGPKIIECHPRLSGGPLWNLALESTGIDYLPQAVRIACGEEPEWEKLKPTKRVKVTVDMAGNFL